MTGEGAERLSLLPQRDVGSTPRHTADYKQGSSSVHQRGYDCLSVADVVQRRDELLRVGEAAAALRCSRSSVYRRIDGGTLPAYRLGREHGPLLIRSRDLEALLRPARPEEGTE